MSERRHGDLSRPRAADVDHQETERPSDGRVRAIAGTEDAEGAVETDARSDRSVNDDEGRGEVSRGRDPMEIGGGVAGAFGGGDHDRQVVGPTAGQHRVDRGLLDGQPAEVRRHLAEQLVARAPGSGEHPLDALSRGRHDRQPVGHAFVEPDLELVGRHRAVRRCYTENSRVLWGSGGPTSRAGGERSGNSALMTLAVTRGAILGISITGPGGAPPGGGPPAGSDIPAERAPGFGSPPNPEDPENIWILAVAGNPSVPRRLGRGLKPWKNGVFVSGWHGLCYC